MSQGRGHQVQVTYHQGRRGMSQVLNYNELFYTSFHV